MQYKPRKIPETIFDSKEKLDEYLSLTYYNPDRKKHICSLCKKTFKTLLGASNHVDYKHYEKVKEIADR